MSKAVARAGLGAFARITAPPTALAARKGIATERYMRSGVLPVPVHYYQPIFDPESIPDAVWSRRHDMPGVEFREQAQFALLEALAEFGDECRWPEHADSGYYAQNASFGSSTSRSPSA
jgi:hypothetical protein